MPPRYFALTVLCSYSELCSYRKNGVTCGWCPRIQSVREFQNYLVLINVPDQTDLSENRPILIVTLIGLSQLDCQSLCPKTSTCLPLFCSLVFERGHFPTHASELSEIEGEMMMDDVMFLNLKEKIIKISID